MSYAAELARFNIDTSIIVPGAFTHGTNHFANSGHPADQAVVAAYDTRYPGLMDQVGRSLAELEPADADVADVARAIVRVVDTPAGRRPFRVHIDPADDGAEVVNAVGDRIRTEFLRRIGLADLLTPTSPPPERHRGRRGAEESRDRNAPVAGGGPTGAPVRRITRGGDLSQPARLAGLPG